MYIFKFYSEGIMLINKINKLIYVGIISSLFIVGANAEDVSFKVTNTTNSLIKEVLVSQDAKEWGFFDIGQGIKPGEEITLIWSEDSSNENCKQYIKAVWKDKSESEPVKFDFCEDNLELEF
jgi:hypothetical protein